MNIIDLDYPYITPSYNNVSIPNICGFYPMNIKVDILAEIYWLTVYNFVTPSY